MVTYSGGKFRLRRDRCEKNVSTIKKEKEKNSWISRKEPLKSWKEGFEEKEEKRQVETRRLTREERLRLRRDFRKVFKNGKSVYNEYFRIVYVKNDIGLRRMAVLIKKKIGKAVYRNRIRRLVKEFFRNNKGKFPESVDMVFLAREKLKGKKKIYYKDVEKMILNLVERMK